ncbi:lipopolysaccharide biosynthesis protein [Puia sp.]|jgi:O-antigen/teichoic acid export membrane protein|uniref:lipopolysaccharide biosynthesis protein n=1 Tax=Puia sp. TaxID=2045100 RepID=UPI002F40A8E8
MSTIRRQSIISSSLVYFGFALGFVYTLLFAKGFTPAQYGLTNIFMALGTIMYYFGNLGAPAYIYKFFPYYRDRLPREQNDMITWALLTGTIGFLLVIGCGLVFKGLVIRKFSAESPDLVKYYYLLFPFGFGLSFFTLLEAYAWQLKKSVVTNFFREVQFRMFTILLILLFFAGILKDFDIFIKLYAFSYLTIALALFIYLIAIGEMHFTFTVSKVTRRFRKKILRQAMLVWSGQIWYNLSLYFGQIVIAAIVPGGLKFVGIYGLAQIVTSLIQAPQRAVVAASFGPLSQAWKDKDLARINRIYKRSSINQLIFSVAMFILIWMNFTDGVTTFHLKPDYLLARNAFFFFGLMRVVDMGTGVNSQIIYTSTYWRFDFYTGVILAVLTIPMNYLLTKAIGFTGPAVSDLITFSIYNTIRWLFLYRKFQMQPFTMKTLYTLLLGGAMWWLTDTLFAADGGFLRILVRSLFFVALYGAGVLALRLSEDVLPIWNTVKKRLGWRSAATR